jgi:hypothetical protein
MLPDFKFQLLVAKDLETVLALSSTVSANSNDRAPLATALLQIFRHEHQEAHLLKTLNDLDIDNEGETLFYVSFRERQLLLGSDVFVENFRFQIKY